MPREYLIDQEILSEVLKKINKEEKAAKKARTKEILKTVAICVGIAAIGGVLFTLDRRNEKNELNCPVDTKDIKHMANSEMLNIVENDSHTMDVDYIRALSDRVNEIVAEQGETEEAIDLVDEMNSLLDKGVLLEDVIEPGSIY